MQAANWVRYFAWVLVVSFCCQSQAATELKVSVPSNLESVRPHSFWNFFDTFGISAYCEALVHINEDGEIVGNLVRKWSVSPDQKSFRFFLKNNVLFHDGTALSSDDVISSISRHYWSGVKSGYSHPLRHAFGEINWIKRGENLKNLVKHSESEFEVKLKNAYPPFISFLSQVSFCITKKGNPLIGTGPLKIKSVEVGKWEFDRFDKYRKPYSGIDHLYLISKVDEDSVNKALEVGEIDLAFGNFRFKTKRKLAIGGLGFLTINHFYINPNSGHFEDRDTRKLLGDLLQKVAWQPGNSYSNQFVAHSLLPSSSFATYKKRNDSSISDIAKRLKKKMRAGRKIKFKFVKRMFKTEFFETLQLALKRENIPFEFDFVSVVELGAVYKNLNFDVSHFPMTPPFYDPDGMFIGIDQTIEVKSMRSSNFLSKIKGFKSKRERIQRYALGLNKFEDQSILVPGFYTKISYASNEGVQLPETLFRNVLEIWKIKKVSHGM